ncbi:hypothetical protein GL263_18120 [Streptomyces durbertensis]|uniref:Uncharacterized protein n=1 Tax=Streptomyces durbertensis TaxID=2448886 RepID=A0ABR6EJE0_9ACTN|nr:hypothetical protein [Streptomyces durbertensis]MBB1245464.1 hypothetical protein [Streptomyces durbertensis]
MAITAAVSVCVAAAAWWFLRDPTPYELRDAPKVQVTVQPEKSRYPDVKEVAQETELVIKVYVQRLQAGDAADLARIGAPWYSDREQAAQQLISQYGERAGEPVKAVVVDPVVPYITYVDLSFADGSKQRIGLSKDGRVWWLQLGDGDPVKP